MAAAADALLLRASPTAAPQLSGYPQFAACATPEKSDAIAAYRGYIRPFSDDASARRILCALDQDLPVQISEGRLDVELPNLGHPLDEYIVNMAQPCTILLLDFPVPAHPRAYLLDPPMIPRLSACPHLRTDKAILIDDHEFPAMCVYSGALQKFDESGSRLEQFLDQTATYLAKHLIWLRTRQLYRRTPEGPKLIRPRTPSRNMTSSEAERDPTLYWDGHWPGRAAPSSIKEHLATIKQEQECWCWSGEKYGACCRPRELEIIARLEREWMCGQFVRKLMVAVHNRREIAVDSYCK